MKKIVKVALLGLVGLTLASCKSGGQLTYEEAKQTAAELVAEPTQFVGKTATHKGTLKVTSMTEGEGKVEKIKAFLLDLNYEDDFRFDEETKEYKHETFQDSFVVNYDDITANVTALNYEMYTYSPKNIDTIHKVATQASCEEVYTFAANVYTISLVFSQKGVKTPGEKFTYGFAREISYQFDEKGALTKAKSVSAYTIVNEKSEIDYQFIIDCDYSISYK